MTQQLVVGEWYELPGIPDVIICLMKTDNFLMYPEWITQRDTLMRSKKKASLDHLRVLFPTHHIVCLLYTSPSPRDGLLSRMPSSA